MIDLALASGIPPAAWLDAGGRAIVTAEQLLDQAYTRRDRPVDTGPQMSG